MGFRMKKNVYLSKLFMFTFCFLTTLSYGNIRFSENNQLIYSCIGNNLNCEQILVPIELNDKINESTLSIDTFFGKKYLLMRPKYNSTPNICYSLYEIKNHNLQKKEDNFLSDSSQLCSYRKVNDQLINRFRTDGKWYEILYKKNKKYYQIVLEDQCVDCEMVQRKVYNKELNYLLVTNEDNIFERKPLIEKIKVNKAYLYDEPEENSKTNIYLIENDKVQLLQYQDDFYQIKYINKKNKQIIKWLHSNTIMIN